MTVIAIVPSKDRADSVAATVAALRGAAGVDDVLVVDDGSVDATAAAAVAAGARVLRLPANVGKGGAVAAGVAAVPDADVYLLVDADVGDTAGLAAALLRPVLEGDCDMAIGVLPPAGRRGGFGKVRDLARRGIRKASGFEARAPLSGQRAVRGELLRSLSPSLASRFGLEVGLTIDAVRAGARVQEVDVAMDHRHTGRSVSGFRHRARQGVDILRALWPRVTTARQRIALIVAAAVLLTTAAFVTARRAVPPSVAPSTQPARVVVFGWPGLSWADIGTGRHPTLDRLQREGAVAAMSVRTASKKPSALEAYATLGAGSRVMAQPPLDMEAMRELNEDRHLPTAPGELGDALARAGKRAVVLGRPDAAAALVTSAGAVVREGQILDADVVVVDPTRDYDAELAKAAGAAPANTLVLVAGVTPPGDEWRLTPIVAWGAGVHRGYLQSPSVRRLGVVTLTDIAPTVLDAVGVPKAKGMIGHALRYQPGEADLSKLRRLDRDAAFRERIYFPITLAYIIFQALVYLFAMVAIGRGLVRGRLATLLRWIVLGVAAWPVATFVLRAVPNLASHGAGAAVAVLLAVDVLLVVWAARARGHPLHGLTRLLGVTVALLFLDVAFGARLQTSSVLGYSLHTAARFRGFGNTAFAVLASSVILWAAAHVQFAPRRREALWTVAVVFAMAVVFDGAPDLGDDVGGILTLVPVLGVTFLALWGKRIRLRTLVALGLAALVLIGVAAGIDMLRPEESRTHLGRLVTDIRESGGDSFFETVERKLSTNRRTYKSVWLWAIVIIALYMTFIVAWGRGLSRLLPQGSALRVGALAALSAGLLGNFLNDSGAVVTALVFVFLGPYLTLLALHHERGSPELLGGPP